MSFSLHYRELKATAASLNIFVQKVLNIGFQHFKISRIRPKNFWAFQDRR